MSQTNVRVLGQSEVAAVLDDIEGICEDWLSLEHPDTRQAWADIRETINQGREKLGLATEYDS